RAVSDSAVSAPAWPPSPSPTRRSPRASARPRPTASASPTRRSRGRCISPCASVRTTSTAPPSPTSSAKPTPRRSSPAAWPRPIPARYASSSPPACPWPMAGGATGERPTEFVPQRRIDGFDLASARLVHERVIMPSVVLTEIRPVPKLHAGQVVVLDGRNETVDELLHNLYDVQQALAAEGLAAAPLSQI